MTLDYALQCLVEVFEERAGLYRRIAALTKERDLLAARLDAAEHACKTRAPKVESI